MNTEPRMMECDGCDSLTLYDKTTEMYGCRLCPPCAKDCDVQMGVDCPRCGKGVADEHMGFATDNPGPEASWDRMCRWCADERNLFWSST